MEVADFVRVDVEDLGALAREAAARDLVVARALVIGVAGERERGVGEP